jgi:hypothetical protein
MPSSGSSDEDTATVSESLPQKRKLPKSFKLDGTKKSGRAAKARKVARQHAQKLRNSGVSSHESPWMQACSGSDHPFFARVPVEMRKEVLSHLAPRDLALIRRSCQQLHDVVDNFEAGVAQRTITYHINRLQASLAAAFAGPISP